MPSTRRLTTLVGAAFVGLAATALIASPASAHHANLTVDKACDTESGMVKVTFTITNSEDKKAKLTAVTAEPATMFKTIKNDAEIDKSGKLTETVMVTPGTILKLGYTAKWTYKSPPVTYKVDPVTVKTDGICGPECPPSIDAKTRNGDNGGDDCKPECPPAGVAPRGGLPLPPACSPSPSTSPSKPTESGSPSPSHSTSASPSPSGGTGGGAASPTPSKSATAPALPVTGAQTGLLAGGALVLLGAGAGMFFLARRRRLKFEA
jgi:hypothetical protein